ncbi:hypothetical protein Angca_001119 [Angiostrongylus cantonensis]|nr:hypothetical protein Angca_001119 [Angiostrongylus cantonensis]
MDLFDIRRLINGPTRDFVVTDNDYWAFAFLPIVMIGVLVIGICGFYQYKKWRHEKKQIAHLNDFYDICEASTTSHHGKLIVEHPEKAEVSCYKGHRSVLLPPTEASPFFQPSKKKSVRFDVPQKATSAKEVIFHFTNLNVESRKISFDELSESEIEYIV